MPVKNMAASKYSELLAHIKPEYNVPQSFFEPTEDDNTSCIFLVSCLNNETILFLEESFENVTGYPAELLMNKGLSFWFPLIHPDDMPSLSASIKESHQHLATPGFSRPFPPLILEYKFKRSTGEWIRLRETKYLLLEGDEIAIDKVLCKIELLKEDKKSCTALLDFALAYDQKYASSQKPLLTAREIEILKLIGKGLSTKMIADQCGISINTVETHRRHLLEKLKVKNSMELVKEASKIFSLD